MSTSPFVPEYANSSLPIRRIPTPKVLLRIWYVCLLMAIATALLCLITDIENAHFDNFFPRRPSLPGSHWLVSCKKDIVHDEGSWRTWQTMITEREDWLYKPLAPDDRHALAQRIADNGRWNRFVVLVQWDAPALFVLSIALSILATFLLYWLDRRTATWRWPITLAMAAAGIIVFLDVFQHGYLGVYLSDHIW